MGHQLSAVSHPKLLPCLLWPPAEHLRPCMSLSRFLMLQEELEIKPDDSHPRGFVSYCASSNYRRVSSQWNCDSRQINEPACARAPDHLRSRKTNVFCILLIMRTHLSLSPLCKFNLSSAYSHSVSVLHFFSPNKHHRAPSSARLAICAHPRLSSSHRLPAGRVSHQLFMAITRSCCRLFALARSSTSVHVAVQVGEFSTFTEP